MALTVRRRIAALLTAAALLSSVTLASAAPAAAATGGKIGYAGGDKPQLLVCKNWATTTCQSGQWMSVKPGNWAHQAPFYWQDSDGFRVPAGCTAVLGTSPIKYAAGSSFRDIKVTDYCVGNITLDC